MKLDFPVTALVIAVATVATACCEPGGVLLGPFVHATWGHLIRDVSLVALAGIPYEAPLRDVRVPLFVGGLVLPAAAVLLATDATFYCGLSGLSHALLAAALTFEARRRRSPFVLAICGLGLVKVGHELVTGAPAFPMALGAHVRQSPLAHAVGAAVGIACARYRSGRRYCCCSSPAACRCASAAGCSIRPRSASSPSRS